MTDTPIHAAADPATRYVVPGRITHVCNKVVAWLTRRGISVWGSRVLHVRGRRSGEWRATPVNLLGFDGADYLVSPRGQSQWVRNLRVAGGGELRVGRRVQAFTASEVADADKVPVLRSYLRRWKMEVGVFFDGVDADTSDEELAAIAAKHPVFAITHAEATR